MSLIKKVNMLAITIILALFAEIGQAATYYVAPTGTSTWTQCQNINTPCSGKTAVTNAVAGDIVYFRGGTYDPASDPVQEWIIRPNSLKYETLPWNPQNSGTENNPITFKAYLGETPVFLDNIYGGAFGVANRNWIVWDGFTATMVDSLNAVLQLVTYEQASNSVLRNCHLIGTRKATVHNSGLVRLNYSNNILIENNRMHGMNGYEPTDPEYRQPAVNSAAILNFYSRNMTIRNNDIYNNYLGIWDKDTEQNNQYYNNHIWGSNTPSGGCDTGIQINDQADEYGSTSGTKAYNNIIRNCDIGISIYDGVGTNNSVEIYNNTIVDTDLNNQTGIVVTESSIGSNIYNNIIYGYQSQVRYYIPVSTRIAYSNYNFFYSPSTSQWNVDWSSAYNSLSAWSIATSLDANSRTTNPQFMNVGDSNAEAYKLSSSSPAVGSGRNNSNIGAYTSNDLIIGYTGDNASPVTPQPPTPQPPENQSTVFFEENFEDSNFTARGWYDGTNLRLSTTEHAPGSTSSAEYYFAPGAQTAPSGSAIRKKFTETDEIYVSYYVKYSANWEGSNRGYHPHEFLLLTNVDGDYSGLSRTHLTTYIEQNEGVPILAIQDSLNIDENNVGVDLTNVTENRAVAGCNGTLNSNYTIVDCYGPNGTSRNETIWRAGSNYFQDSPGQYYKNDWHKIEAYFKMNTIVNNISIANGIAQYWYDGELIINQANVQFRTGQHPNMLFDMIAIAPWIGDGSPVAQTMWIDNLVVATTRPGGAASRPSPISNLTVQ